MKINLEHTDKKYKMKLIFNVDVTGIKPFYDIEDLVKQLAQYCIDHNLYRRGNDFYNFSDYTLDQINMNNTYDDEEIFFDDGYMFLDEPHGKTGLVRLNAGPMNPKWCFWEKDGKLQVEMD